MRSDDLAVGVLSPEDGWLDPNGVLQGFRKKARAMGSDFLSDRVVDVYTGGRRVTELELGSGSRVRADPRGFNFDLDPDCFENVVWPACASRIPAFEKLKLNREWVGLYDECELDGNMVLGNWPGTLDNFYVACGFSGHGLMHAPAVGRALAELVVKGRYETLDLTRMGYQRVLDKTPYAETGII